MLRRRMLFPPLRAELKKLNESIASRLWLTTAPTHSVSNVFYFPDLLLGYLHSIPQVTYSGHDLSVSIDSTDISTNPRTVHLPNWSLFFNIRFTLFIIVLLDSVVPSFTALETFPVPALGSLPPGRVIRKLQLDYRMASSLSSRRTLSGFPLLTAEEFETACHAFLGRVHVVDDSKVGWSSIRLDQRVS
ncbi:uncharacterized protein An18g06620 [Aspergillus niger]|uniref:Contig An18c0220, genomic contig n=2 Tax=Aspergillus niger TaxID=5061 RepID=A2RBG3_ASPNC|nr:uncharacterized protein An18g06620 [Aspergillus niger]CAK43369.1 unnamed protein product [Aspergillus niger]